MNSIMKKRLDAIEGTLVADKNRNGIVFIPLENESDEELDRRIERWCLGEKVEGQDRTYTGNEDLVARVRFVSSASSC